MSTLNSTRVANEIEEAILSGQLKPKEHLIEMNLLSEFGVSRAVIRDAFKKLEAKGLIRSIPYRGVAVADLTIEEIEEIYFLRIELEKIAARLLLKRVTPKEIRNFKILCDEARRHLRARTHQMILVDSQFHRAIIKTSGNNHLTEMIEYLYKKAHIVRFNAWSVPNRIEQSIAEHREIIKAIEKQNLSRLQKLIVKHLRVSKNSYISQLKRLAR